MGKHTARCESCHSKAQQETGLKVMALRIGELESLPEPATHCLNTPGQNLKGKEG